MEHNYIRKEVEPTTSFVNVTARQQSQRNVMQLRHIEGIVEELHGLKENEFSPYRAAKIVNESFGIDLKPQMFYNYVKKGYITATFGDEGWRISKNELIRFATKYALRNLLSL